MKNLSNLTNLAISGLAVSWLFAIFSFFIINGFIWGLIPSHYAVKSSVSCFTLYFLVAMWFLIMFRKKSLFYGLLSGFSLALLWGGGMLLLWGDFDMVLILKFIYSSLVLGLTLSIMVIFYYFTKSNGSINP